MMEIAKDINSRLVSYLFLLGFFGSRFRFCLAEDTIVPGQSISGEQTLVSAGEKFVLGFFSPGNSQNHYLGIWLKQDEQTIVWVANREDPITGSSAGVLKFSNDGNLTVFYGNQNGRSLWSTASSVSARSAKLLDSGNLVLIDEDDNSGRILWQSFDYPTDTFIPGMKIGRNLKTGLNWSLTSWKSSNDPSPGNLTLEIDFIGLPQLLILKGHSRYWSSGPWNGQRWLGALALGPGYFASYSFIIEDQEEYYTIPINISTAILRIILDNSGVLQIYTWSEDNHGWVLLSSTPRGPCELYAACGPFGFCSVASFPTCSCLTGFEPKSQQDWDSNDWTGGCVRKTALRCGDEDGFLRLIRMKLPDTMTLDEVDESLSLQDCKAKCLNKCSCTGYANFGIRGAGSGCAIWSGPLLGVQEFASGGVEFYLRVASSELGPGTTNETITSESSSKRRTIAIIVATFLSGLLFVVVWCGCCMRKKKKKNINDEKDREEEDGKQAFFNLDVIEAATDNFSLENKLGEGGFGPVYKGKLPNGQEIAVKRLSRRSGQGILEFENEVMLADKLQHKNLVKLVGYCTEGEEKILIYEYMPNKGLDTFLFDQNKSPLLDWKKRFNIIVGVARGILYLHEDSRLRVIHRDLKASNILLDAEMSPKISDFGMARSFERNQIQANTKKVVGTYGYISPEYAARGLFSEKSDIFSFGILVLEIVSGKKINVFYHSEESLSLTGYGWLMWHEGRPLEFMDPSLRDSCPTSEALRCLHIGLLCVQESPRDRPNMLSIISMLDSETELPPPKKPAFSSVTGIDTTSTWLKSCSTNNVTITMTHAQ